MRIALYQPEIAGNVGAVLRLGACLATAVDIVEPTGFAWSEKALARSGMDYAQAVTVRRHADWTAFERAVRGRIVLLTTSFRDLDFKPRSPCLEPQLEFLEVGLGRKLLIDADNKRFGQRLRLLRRELTAQLLAERERVESDD